MKVVFFLIKFAGWRFFVSAALSTIAGASGGFVFKKINDAIHRGIENFYLFYISVGIGLFVFSIFTLISTKLLQNIVQRLIKHLSLDLGEKLLQSPYQKIENKEDSLFTVMTYDIYTISNVVEKVPNLFVSIAITISCLTYLLFLSVKMSLILLIIVLFVFAILQLTNKRLVFLANKNRLLYDSFVNKTNSLIYGIKELYQNKDHRTHFLKKEFEEVLEEKKNFKVKERVAVEFSSKLSETIALMGLCIMLGYTLYYTPDSRSEFTEVFTLSLFIISPISSIANFLKGMKPFNASMNQIQSLALDLKKSIKNDRQKSLPPLNVIRLEKLEFQYGIEKPSFGIGPIDLTLNPGSITFVTGGNGSGKTTFAKVISGLYPPSSGNIRCGENLIEKENFAAYRNQFSVIWNDNFLFDDIRYVDSETSKSDKLLKETELNSKIKIENGLYDNTRQLSSGQKKRLSLITSLLEDKQVYLFDEWAANQDVEFKKYFYEEVITSLKEKGKTVIVISHDKDYFKIGDQFIEMNNGEMVIVE